MSAADVMELDEARAKSGKTKKKGAGVTRFHVSFPETLHKRLVEIQEETHAGTMAEVLKDSLKLYAFMLDADKHGKEIVVRDKETGHESVIPLFI